MWCACVDACVGAFGLVCVVVVVVVVVVECGGHMFI